MLLEHPRSSKYLADFWPNTSIGSGKNGVSRQKSPTGIVALNPPKEDGGVFCHLTVTDQRRASTGRCLVWTNWLYVSFSLFNNI